MVVGLLPSPQQRQRVWPYCLAQEATTTTTQLQGCCLMLEVA